MMVYFNGRLITADELAVSPFDHGFLYGHGLFETMRVYNNKVFRLKQHIQRLKAAASFLQWPELPLQEEISQAIVDVLDSNQLSNASVRLTLSRGIGPARPDPGGCGQPVMTVFASPLPPPLPAEGWDIATVALQRNLSSPLVTIKSANYLDNILAKAEAKARGAQEALMLNTAGFVAEGSMSNLFLVTRGRLITPDDNSGILPGITRACIIELARGNGIPIEIRSVRPGELTGADEIFLTSSIMEVIPVNKLDGCQVGKKNKEAGSITARLRKLYRELTEKE